MSQITYGSIVPLIGGENLGIMESLDGQLPNWLLSYSPFQQNDRHLVEHLRKKKGWNGDYVLLDENKDYQTSRVDVVNTVCPCAGLSSLSPTSSADSVVNEWLYTTAKYVLDKVKPQVFWGENAPRLYSKSGEPVVNKLHQIGLEYGYTLNLYQTSSMFHGIPQLRPRTFYFFTKGTKTAPVFRYIRREHDPIENLLTTEKRDDDPMDKLINHASNPYNDAWLNYCFKMTETSSIYELFEHIDKTINCLVTVVQSKEHSLTDVAEWMDENNYRPSYSKRARHIKFKRDQNKNYWGYGLTIPKNSMGSFINFYTYNLINPLRDSFITFRDGLRIMKHPDDFDMAIDDDKERPSEPNHMCQNVPVTTARDMMDFVVEYLNGETEVVHSTLVKQSNFKMTQFSVASLEEFIA